MKTFTDYRKLLEQKDIDAVIIGSPDHWHALMMIHASEAGKHVYCEKPIGNSVGECQAMVAAQERYGNVVQVGQWQRSQKHFQDALQFYLYGGIGTHPNRKSVVLSRMDETRSHSSPIVPLLKELTMLRWLGPAPTRPFNASRFHFHFRWFWDYAGGLMTDWGVHLLDYALIRNASFFA